MSELQVQRALPIIVLLILVAGGAFAVFSLSRSLSMLRGGPGGGLPAPVNGKYESIRFGSEQLRRRLVAEGKILPEQLLDPESGEVLRGKRAALRFAHKVNYPETGEKTGDAPGKTGEEETFEELKRIVEKVDEEKRRELIGKMASFGYFASSEVYPQKSDPGDDDDLKTEEDDDDEVKAEEPQPPPEPKTRRVSKRSMGGISPNTLRFRIAGAGEPRPGDPFRLDDGSR